MIMDLNAFYKMHGEDPRLRGKSILMARIAGSTSYNTKVSTSDNDFLAVHVAPTEMILSLDRPQETVTNEMGTTPDFTSHEVGKFCNLLLSGNPTVIECVFAERDLVGKESWHQLRAYRKIFLTKKTVKNYLGYAKGQLQRMLNGRSVHGKGGKPSEKFEYHIIRLLMDAKTIAEGHEPQIFKTGAAREALMEIRSGKFTPDQIAEMAQERVTEIDAMRPWQIPDEIDKSLLNKWLLQVRKYTV
jgi:predicted nucleotidyltransferase